MVALAASLALPAPAAQTFSVYVAAFLNDNATHPANSAILLLISPALSSTLSSFKPSRKSLIANTRSFILA